jgi:transcriptional regulator with XRE-family HTH domain
MAPRGHQVNGALIGRRRTELKLTQAQMADRLGIHWVTQSRIESGKSPVSLELVERIAVETGLSRHELLREPDDEEAATMTAATAADIESALMSALRTLVREELERVA